MNISINVSDKSQNTLNFTYSIFWRINQELSDISNLILKNYYKSALYAEHEPKHIYFIYYVLKE